ncbi:ABC transporter substrate-binding protein [Streptomyces sp. NPDC001351]|uniref:ABC transporter substrate-binding protein n=1 Tax=Streptomyces sp. NPDC001351 TaxID=3364564 RepID=UPI003698286B
MHLRLPRFLTAVAVTPALLLTACAGATDTKSATTQVTIAGSDYLGGAPVYTATQDKRWASNSLTPHLQSFATGRDALNAVLGGQAQYGVVGDLPAVSAILAGRDVKVLAALSSFTDWRLLTTKSAGITSFAGLKGRRVGLPEGTNVQYALAGMLAEAGLKPADVTLVNLAPNQVTASLARGDIDAGLTFPTFYDATQTALGAQYRELRYDGYRFRTLLIAGPGAKPSATTAVLRTLVSATTALTKDPSTARKEVIAQAAGAVQPAFVNGHFAAYDYDVTLDKPLLALLLDEGAWAKSAQKLAGTSDRATFLSHIDRAPLTTAAATAVSMPTK